MKEITLQVKVRVFETSLNEDTSDTEVEYEVDVRTDNSDHGNSDRGRRVGQAFERAFSQYAINYLIDNQ
jgi:hypothetical protein